MLTKPDPKPLEWVGDSLKVVKAFPKEVRYVTGQALWAAQLGKVHEDTKPLKGFRGAGVVEIVADHAKDTFRAVYTVRMQGVVYVLHAFQKKSKTGIKTPRQQIDLIKQRLKVAERHYGEMYKGEQR